MITDLLRIISIKKVVPETAPCTGFDGNRNARYTSGRCRLL